jgi:hypothetical protein
MSRRTALPHRLAQLSIVGVTMFVVLAAARPQGSSTRQPPRDSQPSRPAVAPTTAPMAPRGVQQPQTVPTPAAGVDLTDSLSAQGVPTTADSAQPSVTQQEPPMAAEAWPVDPVSGLTLVNGEPVVGRVFIQRKVDGLRKYEGVSRHYVGEPLPPKGPQVAEGYLPPDPRVVRRHRGSMVQATLWGLDRKRSAMESHHYRATMSGESAHQ